MNVLIVSVLYYSKHGLLAFLALMECHCCSVLKKKPIQVKLNECNAVLKKTGRERERETHTMQSGITGPSDIFRLSHFHFNFTVFSLKTMLEHSVFY